MKIVVRFFARAKELAGSDRIPLELEPGGTVRELRRQLAREFPQLQSLLKRSAVAIDDEFVDDDFAIVDGAEVAILPPVSGGAFCRDFHSDTMIG